MLENIYPTILCGGSGTRLWPLSRTCLPKQFIKLTGQSLFAETLDRISVLADKSIIISNHEHRFLVTSTMLEKKLDVSNHAILLEPTQKNTALAIALSAFYALEQNKDALLLILPADQLIEPIDILKQAIDNIIKYTTEGITTFGIQPNSPHTGYGYIERGNKIHDNLFHVEKFVEKPSEEQAIQLLEKNAVWNSGIFLMRADVYLSELQKYRNDIYEAAEKVWNSKYTDLDFIRFDEALFSAVPSESIDYAIMEHTNKAFLCPLNLNWHDLGSFQALYENNKKDDHNNAIIGDVFTSDTTNSYIHTNSSFVAVHGMDNVAVVETKDAILVSPLDKTQEIKDFIQQMKILKRPEVDFNTVHHRPWGHYESLINRDRFQVKHITVKPKAMLSGQMHHHRSEHWIVVKGTAHVQCGDIDKLLTENESIYIPLGQTHRLSNPGYIPLELIEIQTGSYLGEDDITRLEDMYGR